MELLDWYVDLHTTCPFVGEDAINPNSNRELPRMPAAVDLKQASTLHGNNLYPFRCLPDS